MPVTKSKQGKPLGGIGAERQSPRRHSLILDDRLLSKQYITTKLDDRIDDTSYSSGWDGITDRAPSVNAVYDKINSMGLTTHEWTHESATLTDKVRSAHSGYYGIGDGLAFSAITERLTVGGNIKATGDLIVGDDISLLSDNSIMTFGADSEVQLIHHADNGLRLQNADDTPQLSFGNNFLTYIKKRSDDTMFIKGEEIHFNGKSNSFILGTENGQGASMGVGSDTFTVTGSGTNALTVAGNTTIAGNLTVTGTATSISTAQVTMEDPILLLNADSTGGDVDSGIEVERGSVLTNRKLFWDEGDDAWKIQTGDSTFTEIAGGGGTLTGTNTGDVSIVLASGVPTGAVTISSQAVTLGDKFVYNEGTTNVVGVDGGADGKLSLFGTEGNSGTTGLVVKGGNSASSNPAVKITGALEATTKSFNIPHPIDSNKRLIYGCLEGPEYGMYQRGSFLVDDERRLVGIDLPNYWFKMVHEDYAINLTAYGEYNVWISNRDENGFWVETNAEGEWRFDWSVIGGRKDAKLVVEPDA
jgi:hypothetical protein